MSVAFVVGQQCDKSLKEHLRWPPSFKCLPFMGRHAMWPGVIGCFKMLMLPANGRFGCWLGFHALFGAVLPLPYVVRVRYTPNQTYYSFVFLSFVFLVGLCVFLSCTAASRFYLLPTCTGVTQLQILRPSSSSLCNSGTTHQAYGSQASAASDPSTIPPLPQRQRLASQQSLWKVMACGGVVANAWAININVDEAKLVVPDSVSNPREIEEHWNLLTSCPGWDK